MFHVIINYIMNGWKKNSAYLRRKLKRVRQWHLLVVLFLLIITAGLSLRQNNLNMVELRDQVYAADRAVERAEIVRSVQHLRQYVSQHMNTNTGQIALQNLYDADVSQSLAAANTGIDPNVYQTATQSCQDQIAQLGWQGYVDCVATAVGQSPEQFSQPNPPDAALYYVSFVAPRISLDLAGVSLILAIVVFLTILIRVVLAGVLGVITRGKLKV
jgi:hypothetical protein